MVTVKASRERQAGRSETTNIQYRIGRALLYERVCHKKSRETRIARRDRARVDGDDVKLRVLNRCPPVPE